MSASAQCPWISANTMGPAENRSFKLRLISLACFSWSFKSLPSLSTTMPRSTALDSPYDGLSIGASTWDWENHGEHVAYLVKDIETAAMGKERNLSCVCSCLCQGHISDLCKGDSSESPNIPSRPVFSTISSVLSWISSAFSALG